MWPSNIVHLRHRRVLLQSIRQRARALVAYLVAVEVHRRHRRVLPQPIRQRTRALVAHLVCSSSCSMRIDECGAAVGHR